MMNLIKKMILLCLAGISICQILSLPEGKSYDVTPGEILTVPILIENRQTQDKRYNQAIDLPAQIKSITPQMPLKIDGAGNDIAIISLSIGKNTPPGQHRIKYTLTDMDGYGEDASIDFLVNVAISYDLWISGLKSSDYVSAGEEVKEIFLLENRSNRIVNLSIKLNVDQGADLTYKPMEDIELPPGETVEVPFNLTPKSFGKGDYKLKIGLEVNGDIKTEHCVQIKVSDFGSKLSTNLRTIPLLIANRAEYALKDSSIIWQPSIYFSGHLDSERNFRLEGHYTSHQLEINSFERFFIEDEIEYFRPDDRFSLRISTPNVDLTVGDNNKNFSELITRQSLRGVHSSFNLGMFLAEGFYQNPTWLPTAQAFYMGKLGINKNGHVLKLGTTLSGADSLKRTFTLDYKKRFSSMFTVDAELASNLEHGLLPSYRYNNGALSLDINGSSQLMNHNSIIILSGKDFSQTYQKQSHVSTNLLFRPWDRIHLAPKGYYEKLKYSEYTAPERFGGGFDIIMKPFKRTRVSLGGNVDFAENSILTEEKTGKLAIHQSFSFLGLSASWEQGIVKNDTISIPILKGDANLGVAIGNFMTISGYGRIRRNDLLFTTKPDELTTGFRSSIRPADFLTIKGSYAVELDMQNLEQRRIFSDAGFALTLFDVKHVLDLSARYEKNLEQEAELKLYGSYRIPIGIPIGINRESGIVTGTVNADGLPLRNALVSINGNLGRTDNSGLFRIGGISKGKCYMEISPPETHKAYLPIDHNLLSFDLSKQELRMDITMVRAGEITGKINLYKTKFEGSIPESDDEIVFDKPYANCKVFVKKDELYKRGRTDSEGNFSFDGLEPGTWELIVSKGDIPDRTEITGAGQLQIESGENKEVRISIKPKKSKIEIIQPEKNLKKK